MTWRGIKKGSNKREVRVTEGSSYRDSTVPKETFHNEHPMITSQNDTTEIGTQGDWVILTPKMGMPTDIQAIAAPPPPPSCPNKAP